MVDFDTLPKNKEKKPFGNEVKITDKKYVRYKEGAEPCRKRRCKVAPSV